MVDLSRYDGSLFDRGRPRIVEALWFAISSLLVESWIPGSSWRCALLRMFGAHLAPGVMIKQRVRIKFPWRLEIGAHSWIGEEAWIDNPEWVRIGSQVCVSQQAYLCTGSHDHTTEAFDPIARPIVLQEQCWVGARSIVGPGVTIGRGAVAAFGTVVLRDVAPWTVVAGNPARVVGSRRETTVGE
jgi:putative colanic acid biosynthesis acetyltransferase WcaF